MNPYLTLGDRLVGADHPVFIIAEIGVNHDGCEQRALDLVRLAADAGADAVKLQLFHADALMNPAASFATYQRAQCTDQSPTEMLRRYELPNGAVGRIVDAIRRSHMLPIATPFSTDEIGTIEAMDLPAIKIASPDLVNRPLLERAIASRRPLLLSTGAATVDEVATTVRWMHRWRAPYALLHCISSYPTPNDRAHLGWINELARRFGGIVGYSDHATDTFAGALAVAAGASIIEKHLTYDRAAAGPDHAASADPQEFSRYVWMIRNAERLRGHGAKHVLEIEQDVRRVSRQSLVLRASLPAGEVLRREHLMVQRPGTGIPAAMLEQAVGRRLAVPATPGTLLQWEMLTAA